MENAWKKGCGIYRKLGKSIDLKEEKSIMKCDYICASAKVRSVHTCRTGKRRHCAQKEVN